jgi:hypothetical protein
MLTTTLSAAVPPEGFRTLPWGSSPAQVQQSAGGSQWQQMPPGNEFPAQLSITRYSTSDSVAGYPAQLRYYFWQDKLFQVTITFPFKKLVNFDFNYNVFRSVDSYYSAIRGQTLTFVRDIYALLQKKYGKKQPVFKGLDPQHLFVKLDQYLRLERWNLRYSPAEYYKRIVTAAYARWDFPKTRVIFAINIAAPDKRFDYSLSLTSLDLEAALREALDGVRMQGL